MKGLLYLVLLLGACATASREDVVGERPDGGPPGGGGSGKDASVIPPVDAAPLPDAPPGQQQVTLEQTNNNTMAAGAAIACSSSIAGIPVGTRDNSWYRVFKLSDYGITGAFTLQRITFYTDYAYAGSGTSQPASLKIGTYSGTPDTDTLTTGSIANLMTVPIMIPDADSSGGTPPPVITDVTVNIPANSNLIVELALPDGYADGNFYYIGVSSGGEAHKGYIRATPSGCNMTMPKSLTSATGLNQPTNSILLSVTGTKM
ncbi:MAG TPA: hypothetical protein VFV99_16850 [Kofleriaceae bacterium]|nr:hypothetical protein [Kofleriaceae bacterium]